MKTENNCRKSAKRLLATTLVAGAALCAVGKEGKSPMSAKDSWHGFDRRVFECQPVNMYEPIAKAGIPILLVFGGADTIVPPNENCIRFADAFKAAGGNIEIVARKLYGHHPHGLDVDEQQKFVDFFNGK